MTPAKYLLLRYRWGAGRAVAEDLPDSDILILLSTRQSQTVSKVTKALKDRA